LALTRHNAFLEFDSLRGQRALQQALGALV
jgi:hypothetical protein